MKKALFAGLLSLLVAAPAFAAGTQCHGADGKFVKCPPKTAPAKGTHCRDAKGHFAKCGTAAGPAATASAAPAAH